MTDDDYPIPETYNDDEIERLRALLKEARQYVSDAGSDEEPGEHQAALLAEIDKALAKEEK